MLAGGSGEDREVKLKLKAFNGVQDDLSDLIWSYRRRLRDATIWQALLLIPRTVLGYCQPAGECREPLYLRTGRWPPAGE